MGTSGEVELRATPEQVFDYFANPRHLVMSNDRGPITERSDPSTGVGSWAILKFDQIQLRVEYEAWERPVRIAVAMEYGGFLSGGGRDRHEYLIQPGTTGGTRLRYRRAVTRRRYIPVPFIGRLLNRLYWRRIDSRILGMRAQEEEPSGESRADR